MFTTSELKTFRVDFDKAVTELAKKYDVKIGLGSISYGDHEFTSRLTVTRNSIGGVNTDKIDFENYCILYGLEKTDFGKSFTMRGEIYTIIGLNLKARKSPIKLSCANGKTYKADSETVKFYLTNK